MKENKNDFVEDSLVSLREKASYVAPAGLEAKVMSQIEKKREPFGLRFASAAVLILAVCVGGILYRPWESSHRATLSIPVELPGNSKVLLDPSSGLEKQDSAVDRDDFLQAKIVEQKSKAKKESVQTAAPIISGQSRVAARKRSNVANLSMDEDSMSENSSEQSFGLTIQDEIDNSESPKLLRKSAGLRQEARGAKKAQLAAAPSAEAEILTHEEPRDKRKVIESWLASLRQQKYAELDRQLSQFALGTPSRAIDPDGKEMLFSGIEISDWRIMLKNERYEMLEDVWSRKLPQNK